VQRFVADVLPAPDIINCCLVMYCTYVTHLLHCTANAVIARKFSHKIHITKQLKPPPYTALCTLATRPIQNRPRIMKSVP
jgi:hypothetical protein